MTNELIPTNTPWGKPQTTRIHAEGIVEFTTASHGGIWLSPERNAQVPLELRYSAFMGNGLLGWYEEDEDAEIPYRVFGLTRLGESQSVVVRNAPKLNSPQMTDEEIEKFLNGECSNGIVFKVLKKP